MIKYKELQDASVNKIPPELFENTADFLVVLNKFREYCGIPMVPTSFYRTVEHEHKQGRSGKSDHTKCLACDFRDTDKKLAKWVKDNTGVVESLGLYVEDPEYTPSWLHLTTVKKSKTIFIPY